MQIDELKQKESPKDRKDESQAKLQEKFVLFLKLQNTPKSLTLAEKIQKSAGLCFGLSVSRALMRKAKKLPWWDAAQDALLAWDGGKKFLEQSPQNLILNPAIATEKDKELISGPHETMGHIFDQIIKYVVRNHVDLDYPTSEKEAQIKFLTPGNELNLLPDEKEGASKVKIDKRHLIGGNFQTEYDDQTQDGAPLTLFDVLDNAKLSSKDNIWLLTKPSHACELSYNAERREWSFYDPDNKVRKRIFTSDKIDLLIKTIHRAMGHDIGIFLIEFADSALEKTAPSPFKPYYDYLKNAPNSFLTESKSVQEILRFAPESFLQMPQSNPLVIKQIIENGDGQITPLTGATQDGNKTAILNLRKLGADISISPDTSTGNTPLMDAIEHNPEMVKFLLEQKADPNVINRQDGDTALIRAAATGNLPLIKNLQEYKANIHEKNNEQETALMRAAMKGHLPIVEFLLTQGAKPHDKNSNENTALMLASATGQIEVVKFLAALEGAKINDRDAEGNTALMLAAKNGHREIVEFLMTKGAKLDDKNSNHDTVLMCAIAENHQNIVELLLENKVPVNGMNRDRDTALTIAANNDQAVIVEMLLKKGADSNYQNSERETPLMLAAQKGYIAVATKLLEHKDTKPDFKNKRGETALIMAAGEENLEVVKLLLAHGADPEGQQRKTALNKLGKRSPRELLEVLKPSSSEEAKLGASDSSSRDMVSVKAATGRGSPALFASSLKAPTTPGALIASSSRAIQSKTGLPHQQQALDLGDKGSTLSSSSTSPSST